MTEPRTLRFDLRRLFRLPLLSAGEGEGSAPPRESEVLFELAGENPENRLFGRYDPARRGEGVDVKAVTYHAGRFEREDGGWRAQVVLDV